MILCRRIVFTIVLFSVVTCIAGCGLVWPVSFLKKDGLEQNNGLIIMRLRIKDTTHKLFKTVPVFNVSQPESIYGYEIFLGVEEGKWLGQDMRINHYWKKENDASYFDQYYFIKGKPGRYLFNLSVEEARSSYYIPLNVACDLQSGELVVIGTVDIVIDSMAGKYEKNRINYRTGWIRDNSETASILERFKAKYPVLNKTLAASGAAGKAFYAYYEEFTRAWEHRWKEWDDISDSETFRANTYGPYKLSANYTDKNAYGYAGKKDRLNLPGSYTISYKIRWREGMKDAFYGLRFAQDDKNAYFFGVSAGGHPAIWIRKNGEWQAKPAVKETAVLHAIRNKADDFTVEVRNNQITYKINDELIGGFTGVLDPGNAYAGFFVSGNQKVEVDLLKIVEK